MQVNEIPPQEEEKQKRKRRKKSDEEGESIVDEVGGCVFDGCFFFTWMPWDFDGGCLPDFDGGCFDFDGCTMLFLFPMRIFVILGLMCFGDWDFKHWRAKI